MGLIQSRVRSGINDEINEDQALKDQIAATPGAQEFVNNITNPNDTRLLDTLISKHGISAFNQDGDALSADLREVLEMGDLEQLNEAYEANPQAVVNAINSPDRTALQGIMSIDAAEQEQAIEKAADMPAPPPPAEQSGLDGAGMAAMLSELMDPDQMGAAIQQLSQVINEIIQMIAGANPELASQLRNVEGAIGGMATSEPTPTPAPSASTQTPQSPTSTSPSAGEPAEPYEGPTVFVEQRCFHQFDETGGDKVPAGMGPEHSFTRLVEVRADENGQPLRDENGEMMVEDVRGELHGGAVNADGEWGPVNPNGAMAGQVIGGLTERFNINAGPLGGLIDQAATLDGSEASAYGVKSEYGDFEAAEYDTSENVRVFESEEAAERAWAENIDQAEQVEAQAGDYDLMDNNCHRLTNHLTDDNSAFEQGNTLRFGADTDKYDTEPSSVNGDMTLAELQASNAARSEALNATEPQNEHAAPEQVSDASYTNAGGAVMGGVSPETILGQLEGAEGKLYGIVDMENGIGPDYATLMGFDGLNTDDIPGPPSGVGSSHIVSGELDAQRALFVEANEALEKIQNTMGMEGLPVNPADVVPGSGVADALSDVYAGLKQVADGATKLGGEMAGLGAGIGNVVAEMEQSMPGLDSLTQGVNGAEFDRNTGFVPEPDADNQMAMAQPAPSGMNI